MLIHTHRMLSCILLAVILCSSNLDATQSKLLKAFLAWCAQLPDDDLSDAELPTIPPSASTDQPTVPHNTPRQENKNISSSDDDTIPVISEEDATKEEEFDYLPALETPPDQELTLQKSREDQIKEQEVIEPEIKEITEKLRNSSVYQYELEKLHDFYRGSYLDLVANQTTSDLYSRITTLMQSPTMDPQELALLSLATKQGSKKEEVTQKKLSTSISNVATLATLHKKFQENNNE